MLSILRISRGLSIRSSRLFSQEATTQLAVKTATALSTDKKIRHTKTDDKELLEPHNIHIAVDRVKELAWAKFDESVEIAVQLGVDPRKPNQSIKV
jgi:ribosomal protein L1